MKKISVLIPCYNEEGNIVPIYRALVNVLTKKLSAYAYEIIFIDNYSTDNTRLLLRELCTKDQHVKVILNARNFGAQNSLFYGLCQTTGDCTVLIYADFQDPVELILNFIKEWENRSKIVVAIKTRSKENKFMRFLRTCYYKIIKIMSEVKQIEHFTGFGLYDKSFIDTLRNLNDPVPFLRGIVAEFGIKIKKIEYIQEKRICGKTSTNWYILYDLAMRSITSYTKIGLRVAMLSGFVISIVCFVIGIIYLIYKLLYWKYFTVGLAHVVIGQFFLLSLQLFFIGFIGEYIMSINTRLINRPLVIEEERINFDKE
jgi:glycosyltransferase involved in cell wall biosynthesis